MDAEKIFHEAVEIADPTKQAAYLDQVCQGDTSLRHEVEALLRADQQVGDFLEAPAVAQNVTLDAMPSIEGPGTRIGRYELLELMGEGGMGMVYLAEQQEPVKRRVALKIIKPGMDSKEVIARFEAERQTLAVLDHPNIAHVFDAGMTETGRPYFVMEHVRGLSITKYSDERKLSVEERLELFKEVCEGVHHAHQKGIIHRDIKPSNILVSVHGDRAVPKIIDFGIAKAITQPLTDTTVFTYRGQLLGTPEYMSPEQVDLATQDIDIRSDIYSLGVLLYELLAGVLPFDREAFKQSGFAEIQKTIREAEPATPSTRLTSLGEKAKDIAERRQTQLLTLARCLHRELEWIPMKAMRKDRTRRYRSASELADDIENYLTGAPLMAGPETSVYRVRKFVHKHAGSVSMVALVAVVIILGLVASVIMGCRAEQARQQEASARKQVEQALARAEEAERTAKKRAEDYRRLLYVNHIALAESAYQDNRIGRVHALLEVCPEDLRGWEWHRLNYVADQSELTFKGHAAAIRSVASRADGEFIASSGEDNTIRIWDASSGEPAGVLRGHGDWVLSIGFSPDGKEVVSGSRDNTVRIWNVTTAKERMILQGHENHIYSVSFTPDGQKIISLGRQAVKIWDARTGKEQRTFNVHRATSLAVSPDGNRFVSGGYDKTVRVWNAETGAELMTFNGHKGNVYAVCFSPDGKRIASGSHDKTVRIWDLTAGAETTVLRGHEGYVNCVTFSPDGEQVISGSMDNTVRVWNVKSATQVRLLRGHTDGIQSVAFSPDGRHIISASRDNTVKVWDLTTNREVTPLPTPGHICSVDVSPNGRFVAGVGKVVSVWDIANGTEVMTFDPRKESNKAPWMPVAAIAFSPDAKHLVLSSWDKTIKVLDMAKGTEVMTLRGHEDIVRSLAVSPDGSRIASGSQDTTVKIWDAVTGQEFRTLYGHSDYVHAVVFSPDSQRVASASGDKTVRLWYVESGSELLVLRGHDAAVSSVAFSPTGKRLVSGSGDKTVKVWDVEAGTELMTLKGHQDGVMCVAFSPDGRRIASGSFHDGEIKIWDVKTGAEVMTVQDHRPWLKSVTFGPGGDFLVAGGLDQPVRLWESREPRRQ